MAELPSTTPAHRLERRAGGLVARTLGPDDEAEYALAARLSAERVGRWNPSNPGDFRGRLAQQGDAGRMVLVRTEDPVGLGERCGLTPGRPGCDHAGRALHGVVARVNVLNIVRGRFQSAALGYDAMDPWAGTGLFTDALRLVVDLALAPQPEGFGLHRVEANVQPGNAASLRVLEKLGFRREGLIERMLYVPGPDGREAWRDHVHHAVTTEEWPSA